MFPFFWRMHKRRGLRGWVLSILSRSPKNGAELMDSIEEMSQGWWRPSPGSIYPLLDEMQRDGLILKKNDGRYELTQKSKEEAEWFPGFGGGRARGVQDMLSEMEGFVSYLEDLRKSDRSKLDPHRQSVRKIAQRLLGVAEGGETSA